MAIAAADRVSARTHVVVRLLGTSGVVIDGQPLAAGSGRQRRAVELVELLALQPRHRLHRDQVVDALWPHLTAAAGAANLHKAAHFARRMLGAREAVVLRGGLVELWPRASVATDVEAFERAARRALEAGDPDACRAAAALYDGDLLPDRRYEDWAAGARESVRRLLVGVLRQAELWEDVIEHEPCDEVAHRALMRDYADRGDRLAAVNQFTHVCALLDRELQLDPSPETVALYHEIAGAKLQSPPASPPIRYVRSAGSHVAYQCVGERPPNLLVISGWVSHLALDWEEPAWRRWCTRMTAFARVIRFDKPGTGLSDRPTALPAPEQRMEDARRVLAAARADRAHVLAWGDGGPLAVLLAARHPERVQSLVLLGTQACFRRHGDYPWGQTEHEVERFVEDVVDEWGATTGCLAAPGCSPRFARQWAAYQRAAASPSGAAALARADQELDVRALLDEVRVPTLVLIRHGDRVVPAAASRALAAAIPGAQVVELEGDDHLPWVGETDAICGEIEAFLAGKVRGRSSP